jgi:hypothetical protein
MRPLRNPTIDTDGCCARAASGQAATAPPSSVMNSRRFIQSPRRPPFAELDLWNIGSVTRL